jgi:hypothetical protein
VKKLEEGKRAKAPQQFETQAQMIAFGGSVRLL